MTTSCSWTRRRTSRCRCRPARSATAPTTCWRTTRSWSRSTTAPRCTSSCRPASSWSSSRPTPACRATGPPAAPSRRRWRPAPRSRCRCSSRPARRSRSTPATGVPRPGQLLPHGRPQQGPQARAGRPLRGRVARRRPVSTAGRAAALPTRRSGLHGRAGRGRHRQPGADRPDPR